MELDLKPWEGLPSVIAEEVKSRAVEITDDIVATVQTSVPAYASGDIPPEEVRDALARLRNASERALRQFATLIEDRSATVEDQAAFYRDLGHQAHDRGLGLDTMNAGFRIATRTALRWLDGLDRANTPAPDLTIHLAEALFVYVDALSSYSAQGYADAVATAAADANQTRARIIETLLQPGHGAGALRDAASAAGWPIPNTIAVVVLGPEERANDLALRIDPDVLAGSIGTTPCLLVPNPSTRGRKTRISRGLHGHTAAIGPEVPTDHAARSLAWARRALDNQPPGRGAAAIWVDDHLVDLLLLQDRDLLAYLTQRRLAPLQGLAPNVRTRLSETLLAWLSNDRSAPQAAAALNTHTQTVRYRLNQIRELFGDDLDDPQDRFELQLALRAERLTGRRTSTNSLGA